LIGSGVLHILRVCVRVQMSKSVTNVQELGTLANNLTHSYSDLAAESCRIATACPSPQVNTLYSICVDSYVYFMEVHCVSNRELNTVNLVYEKRMWPVDDFL